ncbi:MAG: 30S ribosomal protein S6 [Bacteroidota bacterium]
MRTRNYETVFVLTPVLSEAQLQEVTEKFKNILVEAGAEVYHEENWGLKKLAYPVESKKTGFYHLFEFKSEPTLIEKLELEFRRDERVMRFLTVSLDKHALAYSEKRRRGAFKKSEDDKK